jgi:hypothetical protein
MKMSYAGTSARRGPATIPWKLAAESRIRVDRQDDGGLAVTIEATRPWAGKGQREGDAGTLTLVEDRSLLLYPNGAVARVERDGVPAMLPSCVVWPSYDEPIPGPVAGFWELLVMLHGAGRDGIDSERIVRPPAGPITPVTKLKLSHDEGPCPDRQPGACRRGLIRSAFHDGWDAGEPAQEVTTASLLLDRDMRPRRFSRRTVQTGSGRVITLVVDFVDFHPVPPRRPRIALPSRSR